MSAAPAPRFSVVLPTHDRLEMLREAIESVVRQTHQDWELIVVDDASGTPIRPDDLQAWAGSRARLLRLTAALGGAGAKRAGAASARGRLLAFLDDDDLWDATYLERADQTLGQAPDLRILFMGVKWFGERAASGQEAQDRAMAIIRGKADGYRGEDGVYRYGEGLFEALLERVPMPFQRPVVYREDYFAIGEYRPECLLWDCDWALRAVLHGECALLDEGVYLQRAAGQGYSSQGRRALEHARSTIEIKESLLRNPAIAGHAREPLVRRALKKEWIGYAWQMALRSERVECTRALRAAAGYGFSLELIRLLARAWLSPIGGGRG